MFQPGPLGVRGGGWEKGLEEGAWEGWHGDRGERKDGRRLGGREGVLGGT